MIQLTYSKHLAAIKTTHMDSNMPASFSPFSLVLVPFWFWYNSHKLQSQSHRHNQSHKSTFVLINLIKTWSHSRDVRVTMLSFPSDLLSIHEYIEFKRNFIYPDIVYNLDKTVSEWEAKVTKLSSQNAPYRVL